MKHALPLSFLLLMSISHHINAVELLVLPGDRHVISMSHDGSQLLVQGSRRCCPDREYFATTFDDPTKLNRLESPQGDFAIGLAMSDSGGYIAGWTWGEAGFDVRVPSFREFILTATDGTATFVFATVDFNEDGLLNVADVDSVSEAIARREHSSRFDINNDSVVDHSDLGYWVRNLKDTYFGDANLDGEFSSADLVTIFQAGQYEDTIEANST